MGCSSEALRHAETKQKPDDNLFEGVPVVSNCGLHLSSDGFTEPNLGEMEACKGVVKCSSKALSGVKTKQDPDESLLTGVLFISKTGPKLRPEGWVEYCPSKSLF